MKTNFFLLTIISNFLNNYFYQLLILFFFMLGDFAVISQIVLFVSPIVFLKDSLSSNQKTLLVSDKKSSLFKIFLKKRIIYASIIAVLYSIIFFNLNNSQENLFIFVVSIIILFLWINELKNNNELMGMINTIEEANIEDGGSGAFYIYLKKKPIK